MSCEKCAETKEQQLQVSGALLTEADMLVSYLIRIICIAENEYTEMTTVHGDYTLLIVEMRYGYGVSNETCLMKVTCDVTDVAESPSELTKM